MTLTIENESWQSTAEQASKEKDSAKLLVLITRLCRAHDGDHTTTTDASTYREKAHAYSFEA